MGERASCTPLSPAMPLGTPDHYMDDAPPHPSTHAPSTTTLSFLPAATHHHDPHLDPEHCLLQGAALDGRDLPTHITDLGVPVKVGWGMGSVCACACVEGGGGILFGVMALESELPKASGQAWLGNLHGDTLAMALCPD